MTMVSGFIAFNPTYATNMNQVIYKLVLLWICTVFADNRIIVGEKALNRAGFRNLFVSLKRDVKAREISRRG